MARWSRIERDLRAAGAAHIIGVDEVGRGPLAGPVVACAIVMPARARAIPGVADSKQLTAAERERLAPAIRARAEAWALGAASVREVDAAGIVAATARAMRRAIDRVSRPGAVIVIDGKPLRELGLEHVAVVRGDARCYAIACASIVAKVARDRLMVLLAARHVGYGWERNAGYGTAGHLAALRAQGLTAHHRRGFCSTALKK